MTFQKTQHERVSKITLHILKSKVYRPYVIDHSHECVNIYHVILLYSTLARNLQFNTDVISY